jgi:putative effector of murein hydrolase LrgA (UPF0299 family)
VNGCNGRCCDDRTDKLFVDGKFAVAAGLVHIQAALWIVLLELNGTSVANALPLVALVTGLVLLVCGLGAAIALVSPDRRAAQFLYSVAVLFVIGGTTFLPHGPVTAAARLGIGSPATGDVLAVAGTGVLAVVAYAGLHRIVDRVDADAL